jgi:hypothetical protein
MDPITHTVIRSLKDLRTAADLMFLIKFMRWLHLFQVRWDWCIIDNSIIDQEEHYCIIDDRHVTWMFLVLVRLADVSIPFCK